MSRNKPRRFPSFGVCTIVKLSITPECIGRSWVALTPSTAPSSIPHDKIIRVSALWSVGSRGKKKPQQIIPPYIITPVPTSDGPYITPGQFGGFLGAKFDPFVVNGDPNLPRFHVEGIDPLPEMSIERISHRRSLLDAMTHQQIRLETSDKKEFDLVRENAFSLIGSAEIRRAFDLSQEPEKLRNRYGRHTWGQSHLLARRLVEAGANFVTTVNGRSIIWDTHLDNFNRMKNTLIPPMEQAFAALLEDLSDRGMLDSTLVVWIGDFGRTPKINKDAGRDHWPQCFSVVVAGGGVQGGRIVGKSDSIGGFPVNRPVTPSDLHATIFAALGYDYHNMTYQSIEGRPLPLCEGEAIGELF